MSSRDRIFRSYTAPPPAKDINTDLRPAIDRLNELQKSLQRSAEQLSGTPGWQSYGAAVEYGKGRQVVLALMANHTEGFIVTMDRVTFRFKPYKGVAENPVFDLNIEMSRLVRDLKHGQKADAEETDKKWFGDIKLERFGPGTLLFDTRPFWKRVKGLQPKAVEDLNVDMTRMRQLAGVTHALPGLSESLVAKTILQQMGGPGRLSVMLGTKHFTSYGNGVSFKWPNRERSRGNVCKITLRPDDTYDMEFFNNAKSVKKYEGIYNDQLVSTFEKQTGWFLSLGGGKKPFGSGTKPGPEMPPIGTKHESVASKVAELNALLAEN